MNLLRPLNNYGLKYEIISCYHLPELEREYISAIQSHNLDKKLFNRYLSHLDFKIPRNFPEAQSIIVVASPSFCSEAGFKYSGKDYRFTIPPTYRRYNDLEAEILNTISSYLKPAGYKAVAASLPHKLLAVHSGLAFYGKNNITYVEGMGSFYQLATFFSDLRVEDERWYDLRMFDRCNTCSACVKVCPTKAINSEKFMINAERCITFFNENGYEFPEWISPKAHNSLIGCMLCQYNCPENKKKRDIVDYKVEFTEEETLRIINSRELSELNAELRTKLNSLDLLNTHTDFNNLKRNLLTLLLGNN